MKYEYKTFETSMYSSPDSELNMHASNGFELDKVVVIPPPAYSGEAQKLKHYMRKPIYEVRNYNV